VVTANFYLLGAARATARELDADVVRSECLRLHRAAAETITARALDRPGRSICPRQAGDRRPHAMLMRFERFDPFRELDRVSQQLTSGVAQAARSFPLDAYRRGDEFVVNFDLPGVDPNAIDLTVERNVLTVTAERRMDRKEGDEFVVAERPYGTFTRQLFLGESLDPDSVQADYNAGVLTLRIPVAQQAKPKKLQVSSADRRQEVIEGSATAAGAHGEGNGAAQQQQQAAV